MVNKEEFAAIEADFIESQEFVDIAHEDGRDIDFCCHHNAYLVAAFLQRQGHENLRWVSGYYQCRDAEVRIHHSWIKLTRAGKTLAILEYDPRQLHEKGGYEDDLMPSANVPEFSMPIPGIAWIVDPEFVELPEEAKKSRWVVSSREILLRYVEDDDLKPDIDFAELDLIADDALEAFEDMRECMHDDDSD